MLALLLGVFWLTIEGANYPSEGLQWCFDRLGGLLRRGAELVGLPPLLCGARARLLGGIRPLLGADEALSLLLSLERARAAGSEAAETQKQAHDYLLRLP